MKSVSVDLLRSDPKTVLDGVADGGDPVTITREDGPPVVLMSLTAFEAWAETDHLLSDPVNAERLLASVAEAREGRIVVQDLIDR